MVYHLPPTSSPPMFVLLDSSSTIASTAASGSRVDPSKARDSWLDNKTTDPFHGDYDHYSSTGAGVDPADCDYHIRPHRPCSTMLRSIPQGFIDGETATAGGNTCW